MNDKDLYKIDNTSSFPRQSDLFTEKEQEKWGLSLARAIESEWFYKGASSANPGMCSFYTQRNNFRTRRMYANGMQPMERYYDKLGTNGNTSLLNLSKKPLTIIPKLRDVIANGIANRDYSIRAKATDPLSKESEIEYRKALETDMYGMEVIKKAKDEFGYDIANFPLDKIPESQEELNLHMDMEYKQSIEMSTEVAIDVVFDENKYSDHIEPRLRKDLIECGIAWVKHRFCKERGVVNEYVDPENKIQAYTDDPFFRNCHYHGEFKVELISDIVVEHPWLKEEQRKALEGVNQWWYNYHSLDSTELIRGTAPILYFTYRTTREVAKKIKTTKTGGKYVKDAKYFGGQNKRDDYRFVVKQEEVIFEGAYALGTGILLKWEVAKNLIRPKSNTQKVCDVYIGVAPNMQNGFIDSLVNRMIPIDDKIQVLELKAEQIIQRITPDGFVIDPEALSDIDLGDGKVLNPMQHFEMMMQTGSVFATAYNSSGEFNYGKNPIQELKTGDSLGKLQALRNEREGYMNLMRDVIGLNKASDASSPDKDSLVGLQKLAALNSNTATRHILFAQNDLTKRLAEANVYRCSDLIKHSDLKEDFIRKIGRGSVMDLEVLNELPLRDFAIYIDLALDEEERAKLENDLSNEVQKGAITTEDKYRILNIKNLKYSVAYLSVLRKKHQKRLEEAKKREFDYQADANIRAAQASEQAKQQTFQIEAMVKQAIEEMKGKNELAKEAERGNQNRMTAEFEHPLKLELQNLVNEGTVGKQILAEDRKDKRVLKEATTQSELIDQRQNNKTPKNFEADEVNLDAFKLPEEQM
jgi:hypothetical protein